MRTAAFSVLVSVLAAALSFGGGAASETTLVDRDGDGEIGEATAIRERVRLYLRRHGDHGELSATRMLERARWSYSRFLEKRQTGAAADEPGWISLGPSNGAGRCSAVAPHPQIEGTLLAGAAGGGVWRTSDGGSSWVPLTDGIADLSVGAVAYAPSDPETIYLGTGEGGYAADFIPGIGLLRSMDGGETWFLPDPSDEVVASQFFALSVHPQNPEHLLAATNTGLLASADGGETWETRILGEGLVGVTEVLRSTSDPELVYAALWCISTCPAGVARVMRSADGGVSWQAAGDGLPEETFNDPSPNRLAFAVAPSDDRVLYVGVSGEGAGFLGSIYSSRDSGGSWQATAATGPYLGPQGWYDNTITVHPQDPDVVIAGGIWYVVSSDGGGSWTVINPYDVGDDGLGSETIPHVDAHDLQWQGDTLWLACDGGIWFSDDNGYTWTARNDTLVTRQYYGLAIDPMHRERVLAGTQDNASNQRRDVGDGSWDIVVHRNFDGFDCAINPLIPDLMYGTIQRTGVYRSLTGGRDDWQDISPRVGSERTPFFTPFTMREDEPWVLYTGAASVFESRDAGDSWQRLSTFVTNGGWSSGEVFAVAVTPADPRVIMVAKWGEVYTSDDGGQTWRFTAMDGWVNNIGISPFDPDIALATVARSTTVDGQVMRTADGGQSWQTSGSGLPPFAGQVARWHPLDPLVVYAGTDVGLYRSSDAGMSWSEIGDGLPAASVHDLRISPDGARVVVATHGRGVWELNLPGGEENTPPTVSITSPAPGATAVLGSEMVFTAQGADEDGDEVEVTWFFSDQWQRLDGGSGAGSLSSTMEHVFSSGGRFLVAAHVDDGRGGTAVDTLVITAYEPADDCATRRVIPGEGPFPITLMSENASSTEAETDPDVPCLDDPDDPTAGAWGSVWFELEPVQTATYVISTCGSTADTVLSAWTGPSCGPYVAVDQGCNDDDSFVHCTGERTDSYLELDLVAGTTYRFMVGSWSELYQGPFRFNVECLECTGVDPDRLYVVPAAAHAAGIGGTSWVTDLTLYNPGQTAVTAELDFQSQAGGDPGSGAEVVVSSGGVEDFADVVATLLGTSGSGAVHILSTGELVVRSRTYNAAPAGTFGQGIPGDSETAAVAPGGAARLIGLAGNEDFRTNIGLASAADTTVEVEIELYAANGELLASREEVLPARGWRQINRIFGAEGLERVDSAFAVVRNSSVEGNLFAYASVVDEHTGDPTYVSATEVATEDSALWIPAAAHTAGVGDSLWRTDLVLANIGAIDLIATIELLPSGRDNSEREEIVERVSWGRTRTVADVLGSRFDFTGTGALKITVDRGHLTATSRTYTVSDSGTYGQSIPAISEAAAVGTGDSAVLLQLRSNEAFRSNVGMVNLGAQPLGVNVRFYDASGEYIGPKVYTLLPFSHHQANGAIPGAGTDAGFAVVEANAAGGRFLAYASVVDNGSDDPVYVPAVALD